MSSLAATTPKVNDISHKSASNKAHIAAAVDNPVRITAAQLRQRGYCVCRIRSGDKRPKGGDWPYTCASPHSFTPEDNIGIVCGPVSAPPGYSLVCVDVDDAQALGLAPSHLPPTGMIDGRPGKPRAHWWYHVKNDTIPPWAMSKAEKTAPEMLTRFGHTGPASTCFTRPGSKKHVIDFQATGRQAVIPPSRHASGELREWELPLTGPTVIDFPTLWKAVCDLAAACDCRPKTATKTSADKTAKTAATDGAHVAPAANADEYDDEHDDEHDDEPANGPTTVDYYAVCGAELDAATKRARADCNSIPDADLPRSGKGGDGKTYQILGRLYYSFQLPRDVAIAVFMEHVNTRLAALGDAWDADAIARKVDNLIMRGPDDRFPVGQALNDPKYDGPPVERTIHQQLAAKFSEQTPTLFISDRQEMYQSETGVYKPVSDEYLTAELAKFCESELKKRHPRDVEKHERRAAELEAQLATAMNAASADQSSTAAKKAARDAARAVAQHDKRKPLTPDVDERFTRRVLFSLRQLANMPDDFQPGEWLIPGKDGRYIALRNGLLDLDTFELRAHTSAYFTRHGLPVAYTPDAPPPALWLSVVHTLMQGNTELISRLQEMFGSCLDPNGNFKYIGAFVGSGNNGKTLVQNVLRWMLGEQNVSALSLDTLAANKFAVSDIADKLLNLTDDQAAVQSACEALWKAISGGGYLQSEEKYKKSRSVRMRAKLIFGCNTLPTFSDKSEGMWLRLEIIPFNYTVSKEDQNPRLMDSATWESELPGILNWAIEGLKRLRANRRFTHSDICEAAKQEHRKHSDFTSAFLEDNYAADASAEVKGKDIYRAYTEWCGDNGYKHPLVSRSFGKVVKRVFPAAESVSTHDNDGPLRKWKGIRRRTKADQSDATP